MDLELFREYCLSKPRATEDMPFDEDVLVFRVDGKMFALVVLDEVPPRVNLKCDPDLALELRDRYEQITPGYHMDKKHWEHGGNRKRDSNYGAAKDDRSLLGVGDEEPAEGQALEIKELIAPPNR